MRRALLLVAALLCSVSQVEAVAQVTYSNPVIRKAPIGAEAADQFVLKFDGEYYLYVSGDPITAYHSVDLINWDFIGPVLKSSVEPAAWNQADVWAPEVVYRNGKFYMYYTASRKSDDWRVGEMARRIGVAVSSSPRGPFIDSGEPVTPGWGIDGDVFRDPDTGQEYLFYSYLYEPRLPGAGIVVDKLIAWNQVARHPSHVTRGTEAWEDKDGDPNNGSLRYTNEGPTVLKHNGRYYMMYSGGSWDLPTYALGYATSESVLNGGLDGPGWKKVVPPILRATPFVDGPGHNSIVKAPNNVDDINFYHARTIPFVEPWSRMPFADRLFWLDDRMWVNQPTTADLTAPDRPVWSKRYAPTVRSGTWAELVQGQPPVTNFIYELNLRIHPDHNQAGGAGAVVFQDGEQNYVRVLLENRSIALRARFGGKELEPVTKNLPDGFVREALHQLLITRNGDAIAVQLDGVNMLNRHYALGKKSVPVGVFSTGMPVEFSYSALTPWFEDTFSAPALDAWQQESGVWLAQDGALQQVSGGGVRSVALKGDALESYEFTASAQWKDGESSASKIGVVAASNHSQVLLAGFDHTIWPFAKFWVQLLQNGSITRQFSIDLPRGFQYNVFHTIRVVKQESNFSFFLDGAEVATTRAEIGAARPGVFTDGARAAFHDISQKQMVVAQNLLLDGGFETNQWAGSAATKENAWQTSGAARVGECCAHSGFHKLLIVDGEGEARQITRVLQPGKYVLRVWAMKTSGAAARIEVAVTGKPVVKDVKSDFWTVLPIEVVVPENADHRITVTLAGKADAGNFAAFDDLYLSSADVDSPSSGQMK